MAQAERLLASDDVPALQLSRLLRVNPCAGHLACLLVAGLLGAACSEREAPTPALPDHQARAAARPVVPDEPLSKGDPLPEVTGVAQTGAAVELAATGGRVALVFSCESLASTRCTRLSEWLSDRWSELRRLDARVIGISREHRVVVRERAYELELPFYVLADPGGRLFSAFGLERGGPAFVADGDGEIKAKLTLDSPEALGERALKSLTGLARESG